MSKLLLLCFMFQSYITFAECDKNVTALKEGETHIAKCEGFFVKKEILQDAKNTEEASKLKDKEIENLKHISFKQEQVSAYYQDRTVFLQEQLKNEERKSFWKGTGMFILGVLVTGAASYAAIKATR